MVKKEKRTSSYYLKITYVAIFVMILFSFFALFLIKTPKLSSSSYTNEKIYSNDPYIPTLLKHKEEDKMFPYRLLYDKNHKVIPIVALTAFFRNDFDN